VVSQYEELQQRYYALSAAHERLLENKKEMREEEEEACPTWKLGSDYVTDGFWKKYALEGENALPISSWK